MFPHPTNIINGAVIARDARSKASEKLLQAADMPTLEVRAWLGTPEGGLSEAEVAQRLDEYGPNEVAHEKPPAWYWMLGKNFRDPFIVVLLILGIVSELTGDLRATTVVAVMVLVSVLMRFIQEFRSSQAAEKLQAMVHTTATVLRQTKKELEDGMLFLSSEWREVPLEGLVPGDIVRLSAGDMIPADVRLLSTKDLFVSQSTLTGEALPIEKEATASQTTTGNAKSNPLERAALCFLGSNVVSGSATAAVIHTGNATFFGSLAKTVIGHRTLTSFDVGVNKVSWLLIRFMLVMVPIIFVINGFLKGDWKEAFLFGIAVAVGLTPEMLPMVVTANLAKGAFAMAREKVIVKKLNAIQNLGAMDILCTDKTGTLTQDKIVLIEYLNIHGKEAPSVLEYTYINSYHQTGLKSLLDRAVLEFVGLEKKLRIPDMKKVDEIPFDFSRRRMSVVVAHEGQHLLICKGAIEEILKVCTRAESGPEVVPLTDALREEVGVLTREKNEDGLRVIAVAYKREPLRHDPFTVKDESDLILAGFVDFLDPPKETAAPAIQALKEDGVRVKVLTGDNELVTRHICKDVGLPIEQLALGSDIEAMDDGALADLADRTTVFAKVSPAQKARIVKALKSRGHTVGFLGDGINDAPALREADVGISVDTGTDIAKESADIILLEKSLLVVQIGVIKGRQVYGNIIKYIKMTASSNFGNVFSVMTASIFLPFLPMLPIHLLIQNLCYDFSQLALPWDTMNKEFLMKPRRWDPSGIARFMVCIGPISSIFDILTFLLLWYVFKANSPAHQSFFQSGWFIEGLLSQTLIVHIIRTPKIPFVQSWAAPAVTFTTAVIMGVGMFIPFTSLGKAIGMVPLPWTFFPWLLFILAAYCALAQVVKSWYIRKFQTWL